MSYTSSIIPQFIMSSKFETNNNLKFNVMCYGMCEFVYERSVPNIVSAYNTTQIKETIT